MSRIFLSHSSKDNAEAMALRDWLVENGWEDLFLDFDREQGIAAGEEWPHALQREVADCEAAVFLVSSAWLDSPWCIKEADYASFSKKKLFVVFIEDGNLREKLPKSLKSTLQDKSLVHVLGHPAREFWATPPNMPKKVRVIFSLDGLISLGRGLERAGLYARFSFPWPPAEDLDRPPYRGLKPLEEADAGIFFGRDAWIAEALKIIQDTTNEEGSSQRLLVVLGASGAGKSSFLRAGLWPRLERDRHNYLPLKIVRPGRAAIDGSTGLLCALDAAFASSGLDNPPRAVDIENAVHEAVKGNMETLQSLLRALAEEARKKLLPPQAEPPALVLMIDQGEELFLQKKDDGFKQSADLLKLLLALMAIADPVLLILIAIRSNAYDRLQEAVRSLESFKPIKPVSLEAMPIGAYKEVIEGPARKLKGQRSLVVEDALTTQLLRDLGRGGGPDALPLLAFTLEWLYSRCAKTSRRLILKDYNDELGGVGGAIDAAIKRVFDPPEDDKRWGILRQAFIPDLADIDPETRDARRKKALRSQIPADAQPLIQLFIDQGLLTEDENTIEPAHESLLRQWGRLKGWLDQDKNALATLAVVKRDAKDWDSHERRDDRLLHRGERLKEALSLREGSYLAKSLDDISCGYLDECDRHEKAIEEAERQRKEEKRQHEEAERKRKDEKQQQERQDLEAKLKSEEEMRQREKKRRYAITLLGAVFALLAWYAFQKNFELQHEQATVLGRLANVELQRGNLDRALRFAIRGTSMDRDLFGNVRATSVAAATLASTMARSDWVLTLGGHSALVSSGTFSPDGTRIVTASYDGTARLWDAVTGQPISGFTPIQYAQKEEIIAVAFSPDQKYIATGSQNGNISIWNAGTGMPIAGFAPPQHSQSVIRSIDFNKKGTRILTASSDGTARIWDATTGKSIEGFEPPRHAGGLSQAIFSPDQDGKYIAMASDDGSVGLWDAITGQAVPGFEPLRQSPLPVNSVAFSPDGKRIITAALGGGEPRLWDASTGQPLPTYNHFKHERESVKLAIFSPDPEGKYVVTTSGNGTLRLWSSATGDEVSALKGPNEFINSVVFSPDGMHLVSTSGNVARLWNVTERPKSKILQLPPEYEEGVFAAAISLDGAQIVTASNNGIVRLWNTATGSPIPEFKPLQHESKARINSVAFSPKREFIVTASEDGTAHLWDAATGLSIPKFKPIQHESKAAIKSVVFGPDGKSIVTSSVDGTVYFWDPVTGERLSEAQPLLGCEGFGCSTVAFSSDKERIVTTQFLDFSTARLRDASGNRLQGFWPLQHEPPAILDSAGFSPDQHGNYVITMSVVDGTVRLWDVATESELMVLQHDPFLLRSAAFSSDGNHIATVSADWTVREWDVHFATMPAERLLVEACQRRLFNNSKLSRDEMRLLKYSDSEPEIDVCERIH
jgi:WD40 repeat protein